MSETDWHVEGDYFESCNCDFLCPRITSNLAALPTTGQCKVAMAFHIKKGHFGATALDGLSFVFAGFTPGAMGDGNWRVGLIVDDQASQAQHDAITAIASGGAGGPMAALASLVRTFAGNRERLHPFREGRPQLQGFGSRNGGPGRDGHTQFQRPGRTHGHRQYGPPRQHSPGPRHRHP